jgi:hypothetical protein
MRKDHILTAEEKQSKKQRLEDNRRLRTTLVDNNIQIQSVLQPPTTNLVYETVRKLFIY